MTLSIDLTAAELAVEHPAAVQVFARHRIDFCRGGARPLSEVCASRDIDAESLLEEIRKESAEAGTSVQRWDEAPLGDLIEHILHNYHRPLDDGLPRIESLARKVEGAHGEKNPELHSGVARTFAALKAELEQHMMKEERILFPMIKQGQGSMAGGPISVMEHEHDSADSALAHLRELTNGYEAPEEACNTWRALWQELDALETSLHQHIHLENNILFPRALNEA